MINNKSDLKHYLEEDKKALGWNFEKPRLFRDESWRFQIALRNMEYCENVHVFFLKRMFWRMRHHKLGIKLGFDIPTNVFGSGLCIRHYGSIVVNPAAQIGKNCTIQQCVCIGQDGTSGKAPVIGNGVYIGAGAVIVGDIDIADGVVIAAGAVVIRSVDEKNSVVAGVPAKKVGTRTNLLF